MARVAEAGAGDPIGARPPSHERVLIVDFGSQYTQLIARRVRELGVYCEILPHSASWEEIAARRPSGLILSGGPRSVFEAGAPHPTRELFDFSGPILGICYGMQLLALHYGGVVEPAAEREYGRARLSDLQTSPLLAGLESSATVWMSHGDHIRRLPEGFRATASSGGAVGAMENLAGDRFGVQFHPEVAHTPRGELVLRNFLFGICGCSGDWTMASFVDEAVERIRAQVGEETAICGLSGGVDSTVAAVLVSRALGDRLSCLFIDNGLLREGEFEQVLTAFRESLDLKVTGVDAAARFLERLRGVLDPELKRKRIGEEFIRVFEEEADRLGKPRFLVQGTLYPDVIESVSVRGPSAVIKSHHNVGGLPERMRLELVEPLRELFKDEVRRVGRELGLPAPLLQRQPFPGPGLAVRIIGEVTPQRLKVLRRADAVVREEMRQSGYAGKVWQSFAVLLPVRSVGVMGDGRTYENVVAVRVVDSRDGMTADWVALPPELLGRISNRIVNEVRGVNRVVYDISSKPPSTIEWE